MATFWGENLKEILGHMKATKFADDEQIAIYVKYLGSGVGLMAVTATALDVVFYRGNSLTTHTVDTGIGSGGVINVSSTTYSTFGKMVDRINASTNWRAVLANGLRVHSAQDFVVVARTAALLTANAGRGIRVNLGKSRRISINCSAVQDCTGIKNLSTTIPTAGWDDLYKARNKVYYAKGISKHSSGSAYMKVYDGVDSAESDAVCKWQQQFAATATEQTIDLQAAPLESSQGKALVVVLRAITTGTVCVGRYMQANCKTIQNR